MCVSRRFLFVVSLAGEQDRCFSQTHLFLLLIHNLEPQAPVISLSFQKIIIVGGQYNGLFTGTFLDIKSTIWGLVPEKMGNYFYEFNVIMSKFGLILISLGSTFSHISWSWLIFLDYKVFCNIFHHRGKLEEKALFFFIIIIFPASFLALLLILVNLHKKSCKTFAQRELHFVFS